MRHAQAARAPTPALAPAPPPTARTSTPGSPSTTVPASAPLAVAAASIGLNARVTAYTQADVAAHGGAVEPPTLFAVSWWTGGGTPGTNSPNTVYLYGHTWKEPAVFNRIKELRVGARIVLTTSAGRLTYLVDRTFTVDKAALTADPEVSDAVPGRLLLIGCYRRTGHEETTSQNIVVSARLEQ